jgi:hypothetical protein
MFQKRFCWLNAARASGAGVAQPGWSVRLIIERSRARIPPPAPFTCWICEDDLAHEGNACKKGPSAIATPKNAFLVVRDNKQ